MNLELSEVKEKIRQRWNESSENFDSCPGHGVASDREKNSWKSILVEAVGEKPLKILDVGTGTGFIALLLAEMGHEVIGVDIAEDMLKQAQRKVDSLQLDVKFLLGDADKLPFGDEIFDLVINRHVFWTMPEPEKAAAEWKRVLKPGGKLVIIDGDWTNYSYGRYMWKMTSDLTVWITEGRSPMDKYNKSSFNFENELPMKNKKRPKEDIKILNSLEMKANVKKFKDPRAYGVLDNIKYGYYKRFVITAMKKNI